MTHESAKIHFLYVSTKLYIQHETLYAIIMFPSPLHWRQNGHDSVSNHQPHDCLLKRLFRPRSKKTSKLRVTGLCAGNSPVTDEFPHKWPVTRKMLPFDDVTMQWCHSRVCHPGGHHWDYYPDTLSCNQIPATHVKIGHPYISSQYSSPIAWAISPIGCRHIPYIKTTDTEFTFTR